MSNPLHRPEHPHIPYPLPPMPEVPQRKEPLMVPIVYEPVGRDPMRRLYERRRVMLAGVLDAAVATDVAAELMSLDGRSGQDIELLINSPGGPVDDLFAVLDVIALSRANVNCTCFGRALGTAAIVLACGTGLRRATPHADISLRCEATTTTVASARDAEQQVGHERHTRERLRAILGERTRMPAQRIDHEVDGGGPMDATAALELGIIDEIVSRPIG